MGDNTWSFPLGTLNAGETRIFTIDFLLNCAAEMGQTHCSRAQIFPEDPRCGAVANWSGVNLKATALCQGDSIRLSIDNTGLSDMTESQDFVVVEDVIMFQKGTLKLKAGESKRFSFLANGATWGIQTFQEKNHPWGGVIAAALEGCGGLNSTGLITSFSLNSSNPFETVDCVQNRGSFDPNDKQAVPRGFGDQHLLEPNSDIEYLVRFQNTGTDTAFTVVVLDTLAPFLELQSVRPGASSHPYSFSMTGRTLQFRFSNIVLPDNRTVYSRTVRQSTVR